MISVMLIKQHLLNTNSYRYVVHVKPSSCDRCCLEAFLAPSLGQMLTLISGARGEPNPNLTLTSPSRCVPTGPRIPCESVRGGLGGGVGGVVEGWGGELFENMGGFFELQLAPRNLLASFTQALFASMLPCCTVVLLLAPVSEIKHNLFHVPWQNQLQLYTLVPKGLTQEVD